MTDTTIELAQDQSSQLVVVAQQNGLASESATTLIAALDPLMTKANALVEEAKLIQVADATCVTEIKKARAMRLKLREVRIGVENTRKALKEDSLRRGKAIDGMANILKFMIEPEENRLEQLEKIAERAEAAKKEALRAARSAQLVPYVGVDVAHYNLAEMPEDTFARLLETSKAAHESREAAARKAEEDRIAAEVARVAEEKRIREENERLRKEAEENERQRITAEAKARAEREAIEAKARKEREAIERKAAEERAKAEAAARAEREAREKLEREIAAKKAEEAKRIAAEEKAKRAAARAPDKAKISAIAKKLLSIELPNVASEDGAVVLNDVRGRIAALAEYIESRAASL